VEKGSGVLTGARSEKDRDEVHRNKERGIDKIARKEASTMNVKTIRRHPNSR